MMQIIFRRTEKIIQIEMLVKLLLFRLLPKNSEFNSKKQFAFNSLFIMAFCKNKQCCKITKFPEHILSNGIRNPI